MITNETTELRNWETLGLDVVGPLATTPRENKYIIVAQDYYSKFLITMAAPIVNTQSVTRWLDDIFTEHGRPKRIITDNGPQFTSRDFKQWARDNNIDISYATPFHHQTNGMVERANRTIETMLRTTTTNQTEWDTLLPDMTRAYNTATHHTTALSPHKLHFGVEARSELDREFGITHQRDDTQLLREIRTAATTRRAQHQKEEYDKKVKQVELTRGMLVLWHVHEKGQSKKLNKKWRGPFILANIAHPNGLILDRRDKSQWVHLNHLKPFPGEETQLDIIRTRGRPPAVQHA